MGEILGIPSNLLDEIISDPAIIVKVFFGTYGLVIFPFALMGFPRNNFGASIYYFFHNCFIIHLKIHKEEKGSASAIY